MKLHLFEETDTATVNGETLRGPLEIEVDSVTVGTTEFNRGVVIVRDGEAVEVAELTSQGYWAAGFAVLAGIVLGLLAAKQWVFRLLMFLFSVISLSAQQWQLPAIEQAVDRVKPPWTHYTVRLVQGGNTIWTTGKVVNPGSPLVVTIPASILSSSANCSVYESGWMGASQGGEQNKGNYTPTSYTPPPEHDKFTLDFEFQNPRDYQSRFRLVLFDAITGVVFSENEFILGAKEKMPIKVEHFRAFGYSIDEMMNYDDFHQWEEIVPRQYPTMEPLTVEQPPPTDVDLGPIQSGHEPPSVAEQPRPPEVDDTETLNDAQEARHSETLQGLTNISDQLASSLNQMAANHRQGSAQSSAQSQSLENTVNNAANGIGQKIDNAASGINSKLDEINDGDGQGIGDAAGDVEQAANAASSMAEGFGDAVDGLFIELGEWAQMWERAVESADYPQINIPIPQLLGGGHKQIDLGVHADWWQIIRTAMLVIVCWNFFTSFVDIVRESVA